MKTRHHTRVAAAQLRPVWLNPTATAAKAIAWLERAAEDAIQLVAFPEAFLTGYPFWLEYVAGTRFNDASQKRAYGQYLEAAVDARGPEVTSIVDAARDLGIFVYLGIVERAADQARGTVFCSLVAIDPASGIVGVHRKLVPTYGERLVWGFGDGNGLEVHRAGSIDVGALNCWENWMPQARHALYALGEELHIGAWPGHPHHTADITRFIASEGRVYSLAASGLISLPDIPVGFALHDELSALSVQDFCTGGSAIAGPDGRWIVEPVADEESLVAADIDRAQVYAERQNFDPTGHYSRPDVFSVHVNRRRARASHFDSEFPVAETWPHHRGVPLFMTEPGSGPVIAKRKQPDDVEVSDPP